MFTQGQYMHASAWKANVGMAEAVYKLPVELPPCLCTLDTNIALIAYTYRPCLSWCHSQYMSCCQSYCLPGRHTDAFGSGVSRHICLIWCLHHAAQSHRCCLKSLTTHCDPTASQYVTCSMYTPKAQTGGLCMAAPTYAVLELRQCVWHAKCTFSPGWILDHRDSFWALCRPL